MTGFTNRTRIESLVTSQAITKAAHERISANRYWQYAAIVARAEKNGTLAPRNAPKF